MQYQSIRNRILNPLIIAILLIMALFLGWGIYERHNATELLHDEQNEKIGLQFNLSLEQSRNILGSTVVAIERSSGVLDALEQKNREKLLALANPIYKELAYKTYYRGSKEYKIRLKAKK